MPGVRSISFDRKAATKGYGGDASSYYVERRELPNGLWAVCGQNKAGKGAASNIVAVVL